MKDPMRLSRHLHAAAPASRVWWRGATRLASAGSALVLLTGCSGATAPPASGPPSESAAPPAAGAPAPSGYQGRPITPAAEPGEAPQPTVAPPGRVVALPAGSEPWGVAAAPATGQVLVALRKPDRLATYDTRTGAVQTVPAPGAARMIDLAAPDGPLLLPAENRDTLYTLSLPALDVIDQAPTAPQPHQAVVVGDTTFVTEELGHAVQAIRAGRTVARFDEPVQPGGITAVADRVAAVDVATNTLFVYDAATLDLVAALPAGAGPSHVVPIGDTRVAVCDVRGNAVLTYDLAGAPRQLGRADVPGRAFWIEADPDTGTIYAALSNTNQIARLQIGPDGTPQLRSTVPTVRQPNSMDLDPSTGTVYVAGNTQAQLQVIPATVFPA